MCVQMVIISSYILSKLSSAAMKHWRFYSSFFSQLLQAFEWGQIYIIKKKKK